MKIRALLIAALLAALPMAAQELDPNNKRGFEPGSVYHFAGLDSVSVFSGNLNLAIPIGQTYTVSPGFSYQFMLSYNSKLWEFEREIIDGSDVRGSYPERYSNAGLGWLLSLGRMLDPALTTVYTYVSPDGAHHDFAATLPRSGTTWPAQTGVFYSGDSTYMRMKVTPANAARGQETSIQIEMRDGLIHTFDNKGNLTRIDDRYGNWVKVVPDATGLVWTVKEGRGTNPEKIARTHTITLANAPPGRYAHQNFQKRVSKISLAAFKNSGQTTAEAEYEFHYDDMVTISAGSCASTSGGSYPTGPHNVPLLMSIDLPDESTYAMAYDAPGAYCSSGTLLKLTLPTKGAIKWQYGQYSMARPNCIDDPNYPGDYWSDPYSGVTKRTLLAHNGTTVLEETTYQPALVDRGNAVFLCGKEPANMSRPLPPKVFRNVVKSRSGAKTEHYFSAFRAQGSTFQVTDAFRDEYSLPFTRTETIDSLPLSTKTFNSSGDLLRTTYAEYEDDGAGTRLINQRLRLSRTVFNDDTGDADLDAVGTDTETKRCKDASNQVAPCWIQQASSNFDGFGHYRQQTATSNYVGATTRTAITNFNPGLSSSSVWPTTSSWLTEMYTGTSVTEGTETISSTAKFDSNGTLVSTQTGTGDGSLLAATCRDASGFVTSQRWLGGEDPGTGTARTIPSTPCSASRRDGEAILTHTYTFTDGALTGHIAKWEGTNHEVIDATLDSNTGLPSSTRDSADLATTYAFDTSSRITTLDPPGVAATEFIYANATLTAGGVFTPASVEARTTSSDPNLGDIAKQYQYDSVGRLWREKALMPDDTWSLRETKYNTDGYKQAVSEAERLVIPAGGREYDFAPLRYTTFGGYDPFGRPRTITAPDETITSLTYRGARSTTRNVKVATTFDDARTSVATVEQMDAHGRLATIIEGDTTTSYGYHVSGKLASVAMTGGTTTQDRSFSYDSRGLLTGETHPELGAAGDGTVTYSKFDARGQARRKQTGNAAKFDLTMEYDPAGRLEKVSNTGSAQVLKQFQFDPDNGRLNATARYNVMPILGTIAVSEGWEYDSASGLPSRRDVAIGTSAEFPTGRSFAHIQFYNDLGLVREVGYPFDTSTHENPERSVAYTHTNGLLTGVTGWATISYQPNGAIASVAHNGSVNETWTGDPDGMARPRKITVTKGTAMYWTSGDYSFDGTGNIAGIGTTRYVYDRSGRLLAWSEGQGSGAYHSESILYDPFGNRQATTISGCVAPFRCYTTSVLARQMAGTTNHYADATYDAAGNVLTDSGRTFTYDSLGMTRSVVADGRTFLYIYTAADERIAAVEYLSDGGQLVTWTPRGFGNELLSVWNGNTWKEDEIWRGSSLVGLLTPGGKRHYSLDHLGSPRVVTNDSGNLIGTQKFTPFGSGGSVDSGALQFTGHERDRASLGGGTVNLPDYAHARLLDTDAGRFLSVDPTWESADLGKPQSWNRYAYALNNPINNTDPDGRVTVLGPKQNQKIIDFVKRAVHYEAVKEVATSWKSSSGYERVLGAAVVGIAMLDVFGPGGKAKAAADAGENVVKITMDEAVSRAAAHVGGEGVMETTGKGLNFQFRNTTVNAASETETKIGRFDVNPADPHVQKQGPHLNLETQVNGKVKKNEHIPIDPDTIRKGDRPE